MGEKEDERKKYYLSVGVSKAIFRRHVHARLSYPTGTE